MLAYSDGELVFVDNDGNECVIFESDGLLVLQLLDQKKMTLTKEMSGHLARVVGLFGAFGSLEQGMAFDKAAEVGTESMKTAAVIMMRDAQDFRVKKAAWTVDPYGNLNIIGEDGGLVATVPEGEWLAVVRPYHKDGDD